MSHSQCSEQEGKLFRNQVINAVNDWVVDRQDYRVAGTFPPASYWERPDTLGICDSCPFPTLMRHQLQCLQEGKWKIGICCILPKWTDISLAFYYRYSPNIKIKPLASKQPPRKHTYAESSSFFKS